MNILERPAGVHAEITSHYQLVAPLMEHIFGRIPIVWTTPNPDAGQPPIYHCKYFGHWSHLSSEHVQHLVSIGAQEFHSWFPLVDDPARARFSRFLLERPWADTQGALLEAVRRAALVLAGVLKTEGAGAIPVLDGVGGISLFVPLAGGPAYPDVRAWAHGIAREAIAAHPDLCSEAPNVHDDGRVHIHVSSNALDRWSIMPYSIRANGGRVATPVTWDELPQVDMLGVPMADFPVRLSAAGEVFGAMLAQCTAVAIEEARPQIMVGKSHAASGSIHRDVIDVLSDGKTRTAQQILDDAHKQGKLLTVHNAQDLANNIEAFIGRDVANGRRAAVVWTVDHRFRINEPEDAWPDRAPQSAARAVDVEAVVARLQSAVQESGKPEQFEIATCDAFAALGFLSAHLGGNGAPDGYADAPLGVLGYRVMIECKSGSAACKGPDVFEASKYRQAYAAQYCALVGVTSGSAQKEAISEAQTHGVSLWGVDDLVSALRERINPYELTAAFGPGVVASEALQDILWARNHGVRKRIGIIADIICSAGWATQQSAAQSNAPADAPLLTEDAAMLLVDQELAAQGAHVNCTREEVRLALEWLTNPLNGSAAWNADKTAIVIVSA